MSLPEQTDDQKRRRLEALASVYRGFPELARFIAYQKAFADVFSTLAPMAMEELFELLPQRQGSVPAPGDAEDFERLRAALWQKIGQWAQRWHVDAEWVRLAARMTLAVAASCDDQGQPRPASLVVAAVPLKEIDGKPANAFANVSLRPEAEIAIDIERCSFTWNPLVETREAFKKKALAEFAQHLDAALDFSRDVAPITSIDVDKRGVEWLVLRRVCRRTDYWINKQYHGKKDNRKLIPGKANAAARILRLPDDDMGSLPSS